MHAVHYVPVRISGRYLVDLPDGDGPFGLLAGFHGYGQTAEDELALLKSIRGQRPWCCCAIEALHHFYGRGGKPGASWMTSRDRQRRIDENIRYTDDVLSHLRQHAPLNETMVLHGFSQGTAMAVRGALLGERSVSGVMLCGGDIPMEFADLQGLNRVHLARGRRDRIYNEHLFERDGSRLREAGVAYEACLFNGAHDAADRYPIEAGSFLDFFV
ncbi:MAG: phospholipase [Prosthecochloris sp.]|uniref:alpha/beta hydrolase n=1 Tax=Prosthecochloris sp. TaxID=290513 RepID=UPI0013CA34CE|nr:phospholipase [Prosthecochloris sp.]NEX12597.1 phospholipase [Prosthecochloris sp.]